MAHASRRCAHSMEKTCDSCLMPRQASGQLSPPQGTRTGSSTPEGCTGLSLHLPLENLQLERDFQQRSHELCPSELGHLPNSDRIQDGYSRTPVKGEYSFLGRLISCLFLKLWNGGTCCRSLPQRPWLGVRQSERERISTCGFQPSRGGFIL